MKKVECTLLRRGQERIQGRKEKERRKSVIKELKANGTRDKGRKESGGNEERAEAFPWQGEGTQGGAV